MIDQYFDYLFLIMFRWWMDVNGESTVKRQPRATLVHGPIIVVVWELRVQFVSR
jgi:hypothetical protein